ncbi:hypothetical protein TYRP_001576 [Tyrophagus putrescentiae]|nr:hypothetical protein TYRP_001576 [Tyrophagus putrescentiae]
MKLCLVILVLTVLLSTTSATPRGKRVNKPKPDAKGNVVTDLQLLYNIIKMMPEILNKVSNTYASFSLVTSAVDELQPIFGLLLKNLALVLPWTPPPSTANNLSNFSSPLSVPALWDQATLKMSALVKVLLEVKPTKEITSSGPKETSLWKLVADALKEITTLMKFWCGVCKVDQVDKGGQEQSTETTTVTTIIITKSQHLHLTHLKSAVDNTKAIFKPKIGTTTGQNVVPKTTTATGL